MTERREMVILLQELSVFCHLSLANAELLLLVAQKMNTCISSKFLKISCSSDIKAGGTGCSGLGKKQNID